jgi:hypothetical protein
MKKIFSTMLLILMSSVLVSILSVQPVRASETVYIRPDGSVDPSTVPIQRNGDIYTFTDDIHIDSMVVERDNIIIDGANHTFTSDTGEMTGITLSGRSNVTIRNIELSAPRYPLTAIQIDSCSNISVLDNDIGLYWGSCVGLSSSSNSDISGNKMDGPMFVTGGSNNSIVRNDIESSVYLATALSLQNTSDNSIIANNITGDGNACVSLDGSSNNKILENNIDGFLGHSISISNSSDNVIFHNNLGGKFAPNVDDSPNAWDDGYPSGGNYWGSGVDEYSGVNQDIPGRDGIGDTPFIINQNNKDNYPLMRPWPKHLHLPTSSFLYAPVAPTVFETITFNASTSSDPDGYIASYAWDLGDGTSQTGPVITHAFTPAGDYAVTLTVTDNGGLMDTYTRSINVAKLNTTISISASSPSTFVGFKVNVTGTLSDRYGNGLRNETVVLYYTFSGIDTWVPITSDTTDSLGNYFAVWVPPATGYFEIKAEWTGNATHSGASNTTTLGSLAYQDEYVFFVESNSTISELAFDTSNWTLSFTATGPNGTTGYTKVTVAKTLVANITDIKVYLDENEIPYTATSAGNSWLLVFSYAHSIHDISVSLKAVSRGLRGDINGDGTVDIHDIAIVAKAFKTKPGDPNWNANADLNNDSTVNILDISIVAKDFGKIAIVTIG